MDAMAVFKAEQWDAREIAIGACTGLEYDVVTPSESVKCLVWPGEGGCLYHLSASNSYSERIAEAIVGHLAKRAVPIGQTGDVAVMPFAFDEAVKFDRIVVAGPEVRLFEHLSEDLRKRMYFVAPAYACEFTDGMSAREFRHQLGRKDGWRVPVYRWDRAEKTRPSWG